MTETLLTESVLTTRLSGKICANAPVNRKEINGTKKNLFKTAGLLSNLHKFVETTYSSYLSLFVKTLFDFYIFATDGQ